MTVWIPIDLNATSPALPPTAASQATIECSQRIGSLSALNDRLVPADAEDRSVPYAHFWGTKKSATEWFVYNFKEASTVSSSTVYWFDDSPWGGCRVPKSWKLYYKDNSGNWVEVKNPSRYPTDRGIACTVDFDPVSTTALKLELTQPDQKDLFCGVYEWSVK
jgi:hypothetical protein